MSMNLFKVGDYITIKERYNYSEWYHNEPMLILDFHINGDDYLDYVVVVDYVFTTITGTTSNIGLCYVELSKSHIRMDKLERILNG